MLEAPPRCIRRRGVCLGPATRRTLPTANMVIVPQHRAGHARFQPEISNERLQRQDGGRDSIGTVPDWGCAGHLRLETDDSVRPRPLNRSLQFLATVNDLDRIDASAPDSETYSPRLSPLTGEDVPLRSGPAARRLVRPRDPRAVARVSRFVQDGQMQAGFSSDIQGARGRYGTTRLAVGTLGPSRPLRSRGVCPDGKPVPHPSSTAAPGWRGCRSASATRSVDAPRIECCSSD